MHGVKDCPQIRSLVNSLLLQVCFGENELIMNFDNEISMTIMVYIGIQANNYKPVHHNLISSFLTSLIGTRISRVLVVDEDTLKIVFEGEKVLHLSDESRYYESILVKLPNSTLVI